MLTAVPITMLAIDKAEFYLPSNIETNPKESGDDTEELIQEYDTNITCEQQPLPQGIAVLLNVLSSNIQPIQ